MPTSEDSASVNACVASSMEMNGGFSTGAEEVRRWPSGWGGDDAADLELEGFVGFRGGVFFGVIMAQFRLEGSQPTGLALAGFKLWLTAIPRWEMPLSYVFLGDARVDCFGPRRL